MPDALVEQLCLVLRKVRTQRFAAHSPRFSLRQQLVVARTVGDERRQQLHLPLGLEHRLVRAVQVIEVRDQRLHAWRHVERFEHVAAHEVGEVAHRLHRHRLMEELQRLIVLDAEQAPELRAIGRKALMHVDARAAQPLAQRRHVDAEFGKVASDRQRAFGHCEEAGRLAVRLLEPEHLRQRHRLVIAGVLEHAENHRVAAMIAQGHRATRATELAALRLVVPEHVRAQRSLARVGAGGLVVGDAVRRHEQRRHRIDQRGLARADIAGEQRVAAVGAQRPDAAVERAPVEHLEPLQPKAGELLVGDEVQAQGFMLHRTVPSVAHDRRPGARRTAPAIAHRRMP